MSILWIVVICKVATTYTEGSYHTQLRQRLRQSLVNAGLGPPLTSKTVRSIGKEFASLFAGDSDTVAKYVQMSFHQCIGGCDGCLDLTNHENKGLIDTYNEMRTMHKKWSSLISLADYGVLSGYASYKVAIERSNNCINGPCNITLQFKSGRKTCDNPDSPEKREFPLGHDIDSPITFMKDAFGLTDRETVALMAGGHSVGKCHPENSGFDGSWDSQPEAMNGGFIRALTRAKEVWTQSENKPTANAPQWDALVLNETIPILMLHSDFILMHNITVDPVTRRATCAGQSDSNTIDIKRCPRNTRFSQHLRAFRNEEYEQLFHSELASAVEKMSNTANFTAIGRIRQFTIY